MTTTVLISNVKGNNSLLVSTTDDNNANTYFSIKVGECKEILLHSGIFFTVEEEIIHSTQ